MSGVLAVERPAVEARALYSSCSAARVASIGLARSRAKLYAANAVQHLLPLTRASSRYATWFGVWLPARRNTAIGHYGWIYRSGFDDFRYNCACTDSGTYASVALRSP